MADQLILPGCDEIPITGFRRDDATPHEAALRHPDQPPAEVEEPTVQLSPPTSGWATMLPHVK